MTTDTPTGPAARSWLVPGLPPAGRAAVRGGVLGNYVDQVNIFLPVTALAPALPTLAGAHATATTAAYVVMATLIGRPLGAMVFGRISDRVGRASTTKVAIAGTATCSLAIAGIPSESVIGPWCIAGVIALRFLGGVFLAGEYTSAIPLAMEWSAPRRRGLVSGLIMSMAPWAQATIALVTVGLLALLGGPAYAAWGWRISFACGGIASILMLGYYSRNVADAAVPSCRPVVSEAVWPGLRAILAGRYAGSFWRVFGLMSGLWFMTNMVVIVLTARLAGGSGLSAQQASSAMAVASIAQALVMACAGHLSTLVGRRRFLVGWGVLAAVTGPLLWPVVTAARTWPAAAIGAALLQVVTVCAYGPIGAYLSESFPARVRATGYGTAYSLSIVIPALYPYYLPALQERWGPNGSVCALLALGGLLVATCARLGPALTPAQTAADVESVAARAEAVNVRG